MSANTVFSCMGTGKPNQLQDFAHDLNDVLSKHAAVLAQGRGYGVQIMASDVLVEMLAGHLGADAYIANLPRFNSNRPHQARCWKSDLSGLERALPEEADAIIDNTRMRIRLDVDEFGRQSIHE